jgi:hypothetical protein
MRGFVLGTGQEGRRYKCAPALFNCHLSSEDKFENGEFLDQGQTERRHVVAESVVLIGKEANMVGASGEEEPTNQGIGT